MKTLVDIPNYIWQEYAQELRNALAVFTPDECKMIKMCFGVDTLAFETVAFCEEGKKIYKPANPEKYRALQIIEQRVRKELDDNAMPYVDFASRVCSDTLLGTLKPEIK